MITISLTDEQAHWLERYLDTYIRDALWSNHIMSPDALEHAKHIRGKVRNQSERGRW